MNTFLKKWFAGLAAVTFIAAASNAQDAQDERPNSRSADRGNPTDAEAYDRIANSPATIGDEVDQQQWYNPADWGDHNPVYNYMTDEFYNERTGQVGYHDYRSRSWNYPGSAWEDNDYWDDDWNNDLEIGDREGLLDWNDEEWWE
jgi:hypothetical protein